MAQTISYRAAPIEKLTSAAVVEETVRTDETGGRNRRREDEDDGKLWLRRRQHLPARSLRGGAALRFPSGLLDASV